MMLFQRAFISINRHIGACVTFQTKGHRVMGFKGHGVMGFKGHRVMGFKGHRVMGFKAGGG